MPWLAPRLPLPVPVPRLMPDEPCTVRHALVPGEPVTDVRPDHGRALGRFLRSLHAAPVAQAARLGAPGPADIRAERAATVADFRERVVPLLPPDVHGRARALLDTLPSLPATTLVHGDLGPDHVLCRDGVLTGVIDFSDAHVGDPAMDMAWALHGTPRRFADAFADEYGVSGEDLRRSLLWHRLGPWHEVTYGLDTADEERVRSGTAGVVRRLSL